MVAGIVDSAVFDNDDVESMVIGRRPQRGAPKRPNIKGRRWIHDIAANGSTLLSIFLPTKGGFYVFNEAGLGDALHGKTECSNERFFAHSEFIWSFSLDVCCMKSGWVCCIESGWHAGGPLRCVAMKSRCPGASLAWE